MRDCNKEAKKVHPLNSSSLTQSHIDLWNTALDLPADLIELQYQQLNDKEKARADRFYFPRHRRRYIAAHCALRQILASYLAIEPTEVMFQTEGRGKPFVISPLPLQFNLSHSEEMALIGITLQDPIGVDIEHHHVVDVEGLAKSQFSPLEITQLFAKPADQRQQCFFDLWSQKEAFIKAIGLGLYFPLPSFSVALDPPGGILELPSEYQDQKWFMQMVAGFPDYSAAVVCAGGEKTIEHHEHIPTVSKYCP